LRALARELGRGSIVIADLTSSDAPQKIFDASGPVDVLINNAGYGLSGPFAETDLQKELQMIQVNVAALTHLTKRFLPAMIARRRGRVLNVASTAALFPGPLMAVYYATKAYVLSFSEALANEVAPSGVTVTALCPGPTASNFQEAAGLQESKLVFGKTLPSARDVAQAGYDGMMAGKTIVIPGLTNKLTASAPRWMPRAAMARIVRGVQERRRS